MLKPLSQYLAALAAWFNLLILKTENLSVQKNGNNENFVLGYCNHRVMENIFNVQCDVLVQKRD